MTTTATATTTSRRRRQRPSSSSSSSQPPTVLAAVAAAVAGAVVVAGIAAADAVIADVLIRSKVNTDLCVQSPALAPAETQLQLAPCKVATNLLFNADAATGSIRIEETGLCMDVYHGEGAGLTNGLPVQVYTCKGTSNQQWEVHPFDATWSQVRVKGTNYCLNTNTQTVAAGQKLIVWQCDATAASLFKIEPACDGLVVGSGASSVCVKTIAAKPASIQTFECYFRDLLDLFAETCVSSSTSSAAAAACSAANPAASQPQPCGTLNATVLGINVPVVALVCAAGFATNAVAPLTTTTATATTTTGPLVAALRAASRLGSSPAVSGYSCDGGAGGGASSSDVPALPLPSFLAPASLAACHNGVCLAAAAACWSPLSDGDAAGVSAKAAAAAAAALKSALAAV
ncbi:ricin B lectin domain-containing protein [Zopfochytrium polystomum]|nr:ricin B lectin domain-containing protein [Zopfochytrium polystomum]